MTMICRNCGHTGHPERRLKGHFLITVILLLCYIIPGIIYMIWRRAGVRDSCTKCGSENIVDAASPAGVAAAHEMFSPNTHVKCPDCKELVRKDANKCKHCGTSLTPGAVEIVEQERSASENLGLTVGRYFSKKK
jgi:RNA polymerase subunit RPABC4/transcription elongation factor Spt4